MERQPLVGVTACSRMLGLHPYNVACDKYIRAVAVAAGAMPLVIPSMAELLDMPRLLDTFDGLLLTGSPSNVEPHHYQGPASAPGTHHDPQRDAVTLPLIRAAIAAGVPVLGICRGFQEMNVALGGTLYQKVHEAGPFIDHRARPEDPVDVQYGLRHPVKVQAGGVLEAIGLPAQFEVNSVHGQGVERLADGLHIEATAPDGLIEAFSVASARAFAVGVQWHPEWKVLEYPHYQTLFAAFGEACRQRAAAR